MQLFKPAPEGLFTASSAPARSINILKLEVRPTGDRKWEDRCLFLLGTHPYRFFLTEHVQYKYLNFSTHQY